MVIEQEYPKDFYIKIEGEDLRVGRLTVNKSDNENYSLEIDVVNKESKKIWYHVDHIFQYPSEEEVLESGVQILSNFLNRQKTD